MRRPVNAPFVITTEFGVKDSYAKFGYHSGVDYGVPLNRAIYAPASGELQNVVSPTGGNMVVIFDGKYYHRLMHNNSFTRVNGRVNEGDQVAKAGTTGLSTGVHCHWDINKEGVYPSSFSSFINPSTWLSSQVAPSGGGNNMFNTDQEIIEAYAVAGRVPSAAEIAAWRGGSKQRFIQLIKAETDAQRKQLADVRLALANLQKQPPKEVIKIVEKIVDRPIEVIKEVPVGEEQAVRGFFDKLLNLIFKKG